MANQHPSADLLDHYLINDLSASETSDLERHVYACNACFSRVASRDMESMAFAKACRMLANLENEGTRVLTLSIPEADERPVVATPPRWHFQTQHMVFAATTILTAIAFSSVTSVDKSFTQSAMSLVSVPSIASLDEIESVDSSLLAPPEPVSPVRKRKISPQTTNFVVQAKYTRPFLPPDGVVEAPELDMTLVPPPVHAARRLDAPAELVRLPDAPKKRVRRSRRVLNALASPFKKIGGALATLAVGRQERAGI